MAKQTTREQIEDMKFYDPCIQLSPARLSTFLLALLDLSEPVELGNITKPGDILPKIQGPFIFAGQPVHCRAIEHSGSFYLVFCTFHSGTAGNTGTNYLVYMRDNQNQYRFTQMYSSSNVADWIKRALNEATATASYPGQMSALMYKRLDAVYKFCVAQGMAEVN